MAGVQTVPEPEGLSADFAGPGALVREAAVRWGSRQASGDKARDVVDLDQVPAIIGRSRSRRFKKEEKHAESALRGFSRLFWFVLLPFDPIVFLATAVAAFLYAAVRYYTCRGRTSSVTRQSMGVFLHAGKNHV